MILKRFFLSWGIVEFLEKLWKTLEIIEIINLSQKKEGIIYYQNQSIIILSFLQNIYEE